MSRSSNLSLLFMQALMEDKETVFNELVRAVDVLLQGSAEDKDEFSPLSLPTDHPANGDVYIVASGATGEWAGHDYEIAYYYDGWSFIPPKIGLRFYVKDEGVYYVYTAFDTWTPQSSTVAVLDDLVDVEIGTDLSDYDILQYRNGMWENRKATRDLSVSIPGTPTANEVIPIHVTNRAFRILAGFANCRAYCRVDPDDTGDTTFIVRKNEVQIGTLRFVNGSNVGVFGNMAASVSFAVGDRLDLLAPSYVDENLKDIYVSFGGERV